MIYINPLTRRTKKENMNVTVKREQTISKCKDCFLRRNHRGHGENFDYCSHPDSPDGYGNVIPGGSKGDDDAFPAWCPAIVKP